MTERDPGPYAGAARWYPRGRVPYPPQLVTALVAELGLDGGGRLLDLGCGPGTLTLPLAPWFAAVTAVDPDRGMLAEGARQAALAGIAAVDWVRSRAEDVDVGPDRFRLVTLAQSFHWMDRPRVARRARDLLAPGGALAHVHATTHEGEPGTDPLGHPRPPRAAIDALLGSYLGCRPAAATRAPADRAPADRERVEDERGRLEDAVYRAAGFTRRRQLLTPARVVRRSADEVVASVFSLSTAAPHRFGDRADAFEADLRALLRRTAPDGVFAERFREVAVDVWRP